MPNFTDDRHMGMLAYIGNKARAGKLKNANINTDDIDLIIAAIQDRDRTIKELNATIAAQDKVINFTSNAARAVIDERKS